MGLWDKVKGVFGARPDEAAQFLRMARRLATRIPGVSVVEENVAEMALVLETPNGRQTFYAGNIFTETGAWPMEARSAHVEAFLLEILAPRPDVRTWTDVRERLLPVVRGASAFSSGARRMPTLTRPFQPFLLEAAVVDSATGMEYVNEDAPPKWDVEPDQIFIQARVNLAALEADVRPLEGRWSSPAWRVAIDDAYDSSRILLPGWLASFAGKVEGQPVAFLPDRNTLIVGGGGDAKLLRQLLEMAEERAKASPRSITTMAYTVDAAGAVVPLTLPPDHAVGEPLRRAARLLAGAEYAHQREHLEARHEQEGRDIFVATFGALRAKDGREWSYSTWAQDCDSLLPRTELVALGSAGGAGTAAWSILLWWDDLQRIAGDCLAPDPSCDPMRYRTVRWPDAAMLEALRAAEATP